MRGNIGPRAAELGVGFVRAEGYLDLPHSSEDSRKCKTPQTAQLPISLWPWAAEIRASPSYPLPGGVVVAFVSSESLAREFIAWLAREYADRAANTMRALDDLVDADLRRSRCGSAAPPPLHERV